MTHSQTQTYRHLVRRLEGVVTSDGAGVKLTRIIGSKQLDMLDPFLLLDCFESDQPEDYIGGFPEHPHRGFETVTYLLQGRMRHKDSAGNEGVIKPGGVQWMTAGKGIVHSEMPEQQQGLLKGFQLWVNLPASAKMTEPVYQEFPAASTPVERQKDGAVVRVIAGQTEQGTTGPVCNTYTHPTYMDITLPAHCSFYQTLAPSHNAFVYVIDHSIQIEGSDKDNKQDGLTNEPVLANQLGILSQGAHLRVTSGAQGARFLLVAGKPLHEPVVRGGPFVMTTKQEVMQAFSDFHKGNFVTN